MTVAPYKMNSRMGRILPDVAADDSQATKQIIALIEAMGTGSLDVAEFHAAVLDTYRRHSPWQAYASFIDAAMAERDDQIMARASVKGRDWQIQVIYLEDGEVHPGHGHHNVVSVQGVLAGRLHVREFDRLAILPDGDWAVRPLVDQIFEPGDVMQSSDALRNIHWFAAVDGPALMLNLNIRGYESSTFMPEGSTLGRRLLDLTLGPVETDLVGPILRARILNPKDAYEKFATRPLDAFPMAGPRPLPIVPPSFGRP